MTTPAAPSPLLGLMQHWPLTIDRILDHARRWHADREVVAFRDDGVVERRDYASLWADARRLSNALRERGIAPGDRVATLAMNGAHHFVAWYAIAGIGAVCHTLNPRMGESQLAWIANHAEDRLLLCDGAFAGPAERLAAVTPSIQQVVTFTAPHDDAPSVISIDDLLAGCGTDGDWGGFDEERAAGLCYTSGTTGDPKGVLYSHRSNVLHTLVTLQPDVFGLSARDTIMPIVPLYHANAWALAFAAPAVGAKLVLPGAKLDGATLYARMCEERVTFAAAVPTAWRGLADHMEATGDRLPDLRRIVVGGAALPESLARRFEAIGIDVIAAWGMTELSPVGGVATPVADSATMSDDERRAARLKQGRVPFGIDMRIIDGDGQPIPHDGRSPGALQMRGPSVASGYYRSERSPITADGWLDTGDIGTIDRLGYLKITDRAKDVIKSGGEWISSLEIEDAAALFYGVALAAVIGVPHPRWDERPVLLVTTRDDRPLDLGALRAHLAERLPKWWLPEDIRVVATLPLGPTGKIDKAALRARAVGGEFADP